MMGETERQAIRHLWDRKLAQDASEVPQLLRHRNLAPASAEFLSALASGLGANRLLEIGGSSGISTIALAAAARATGVTLVSIEIEPDRQAEAKRAVVVADNILSHDLSGYVHHVRSRPGVECMTIPIGKGLEVTRFL